MKITSILFGFILCGVPLITQACETSIGDEVYILYGRNESNFHAYVGNIIVSGEVKSKVEFASCSPNCYEWVSNCAFFDSEYDAKLAAEKADENHTSFLEGTTQAVAGGLILLIGAALLSKQEEPKSPEMKRIENLINSIPEEPDHKKFDDSDLVPLN